MTTLYSCKSEIDASGATAYRITKFDSDLTPLASYRLLGNACDCPAGHRPSCRHRDMLPLFLARGAVNTFWFHDFDRGGWVSMGNAGLEEALEQSVDEGEDIPIRMDKIGDDWRDIIREGVKLGDVAHQPHSEVVITSAFDAEDTGSNPVGAATDTLEEAAAHGWPARINRRGF